MFDAFEVSINGNVISGFPAFCIMCLPLVGLFLLGVMIGASL